jgi:hypothetical protein
MKIKLTKEYFLTSDPYNFIIAEEITKGKHKGKLKHLTYHPTIEQALTGCLRRKMMESDATTMKELLADFWNVTDQLCKTIESAISDGRLAVYRGGGGTNGPEKGDGQG